MKLGGILQAGRDWLDNKRDSRADAAQRKPMEKSLVEQVWDSPATFNRATRRAARLFSRIWRWDMRGTEMQRTYVPRYFRRHYSPDTRIEGPEGLPVEVYGAFTHPKTRRQRRHRAVILRIIRQKGIA